MKLVATVKQYLGISASGAASLTIDGEGRGCQPSHLQGYLEPFSWRP